MPLTKPEDLDTTAGGELSLNNAQASTDDTDDVKLPLSYMPNPGDLALGDDQAAAKGTAGATLGGSMPLTNPGDLALGDDPAAAKGTAGAKMTLNDALKLNEGDGSPSSYVLWGFKCATCSQVNPEMIQCADMHKMKKPGELVTTSAALHGSQALADGTALSHMLKPGEAEKLALNDISAENDEYEMDFSNIPADVGYIPQKNSIVKRALNTLTASVVEPVGEYAKQAREFADHPLVQFTVELVPGGTTVLKLLKAAGKIEEKEFAMLLYLYGNMQIQQFLKKVKLEKKLDDIVIGMGCKPDTPVYLVRSPQTLFTMLYDSGNLDEEADDLP